MAQLLECRSILDHFITTVCILQNIVMHTSFACVISLLPFLILIAHCFCLLLGKVWNIQMEWSWVYRYIVNRRGPFNLVQCPIKLQKLILSTKSTTFETHVKPIITWLYLYLNVLSTVFRVFSEVRNGQKSRCMHVDICKSIRRYCL